MAYNPNRKKAVSNVRITDDELLLLYQDQIDRISELKGNQWRVSHYGLLIQGAIVGLIATANGAPGPSWKIVTTIVSILGAGVASWLIHQFQGKIWHRRNALEDLSKKPPDSFHDVRKKLRQKRKESSPPWGRWDDDRQFTAVFFGVQSLGLMVVIWKLYFAN